ncbi:aldehyde dehydrogenase family protein, partial [Parageobacillus thermoglucosidasius]|uniref:aldehyde dehydrogenase family protein n=1 Tax=Parageobacillus thermoglucosidasius TaxID=1426 RepID=UPI00241DA5AA
MKTNVVNVDLWINNSDVPTNDYYEIKDPGRLTDTVARVAKGTVEDVNRAVEAAHQAFLSWKKLDVRERVKMISDAVKVLQESVPELSPILVRENGGVLRETQREVGRAAVIIQYYADIAESCLAPKVIEDENCRIEIEKIPIGVVAAIVPWNFPVSITALKVGPALAAGNTLVVKPSPNAPVTITLALKKMASVLPPGVINVVNGDAEVGTALVRHPLVRKISFTGGNKTAKYIIADAGSTIKNMTLELGGNDPAIILDDVNPVEIMPDLVRGIFTRSGQICFAVKRVYVPQAMYDKFYDTMCQVVDEIKVGHGLDERATMG